MAQKWKQNQNKKRTIKTIFTPRSTAINLHFGWSSTPSALRSIPKDDAWDWTFQKYRRRCDDEGIAQVLRRSDKIYCRVCAPEWCFILFYHLLFFHSCHVFHRNNGKGARFSSGERKMLVFGKFTWRFIVDSLIGSLHLRFRRVDFLQIDRKLFALADESRSAVFSFSFFCISYFSCCDWWLLSDNLLTWKGKVDNRCNKQTRSENAMVWLKGVARGGQGVPFPTPSWLVTICFRI